MIEIFETCQTKSIAKQTNRDESLIIRSIVMINLLKMKRVVYKSTRCSIFISLSMLKCNPELAEIMYFN